MKQKYPKQLYRRGKQGTLVYSPDIAVFIKLSNGEILDLSPYVVEFNLGRVVNDISTFSCAIDNKFGQFDRVIKRMDRITVFLKRISWLQVFSGYVTTIPWQTVVPGNVTINAQCTLKRLAHNYIDTNSTEGMSLLPFRNQEDNFDEIDGGAASTIVRLLTNVAQWDEKHISIQQIPPEWANDAATVVDGLIKENDVAMTGEQYQSEIRQIKDRLLSLIDAFGWSGSIDGSVLASLREKWTNLGVNSSDGEGTWQEIAGMKIDNQYNAPPGVGGGVPSFYLFNLRAKGLEVRGNYKPGTGNFNKTFDIFLRLDAADSLADLVKAYINSGTREVAKLEEHINIPVTASYLDYNTQKNYIGSKSGGCLNDNGTKEIEDTVPPAAERFADVISSYTLAKRLGAKGDLTNDEKQQYKDAVEVLQSSEANRLGLNSQTVTGEVSPGGRGWTAYPDPVRKFYYNGQEAFWLDYPDYKFQLIQVVQEAKYERGYLVTPQKTQKVDIVVTTLSGYEEAIPLKCPAGKSVLGWATAICIKPSTDFYSWAQSKLPDYGWKRTQNESRDPVWKFVGNDKYPIYWDADGRINAGRETTNDEYNSENYTGAYQNVDGQAPEQMGENSGLKALFGVFWMGNQAPEQLSEFATGERSWLNDSSLLEVIGSICPASVRDFMSAPNGDFIAFVPDRIGKYSNFPAIQIRDIELIDFKAIASDSNLVTHYLSNADVEAAPLEAIDSVLQLFTTSAMMTVEQAPLMNFLLGRPLNSEKQYGTVMLKMFGLRPKVEDNKFIRNRAYNFVYSLHKFQEMWANQWQFVVNVTFMPELYPGMRIELVDRTFPDGTPAPVAVYVESVTHSGSRSTGFTTSAVVSTPMYKTNGGWAQWRPEYGPEDMAETDADVMAMKRNEQRLSAKIASLKKSGIVDKIN